MTVSCPFAQSVVLVFLLFSITVESGASEPRAPENLSRQADLLASDAARPPFFVSPDTAPTERRAFIQALQTHTGSLRSLYDAWIDRVGANGILDGIESLRPGCHSEAHDLGKVIFARLENIGEALRACDRRCHSGCMHGILMEKFAAMCSVDGQLEFELLAPSIDLICRAEPRMREAYSVGDCAHGVGHALMFLSEYRVAKAVDACSGFRDEPMRYYCATGAYMEYVTAGKADATLAEASFSPCDQHPYPAACARYLMPRLLRFELERSGSTQRVLDLCLSKPSGPERLGCIHGLGNAFMPWIAQGKLQLGEVCARFADDEMRVCVEGAMERMARYHRDRASEVCSQLSEDPRRVCDEALRNELYSMDKDFEPYLEPLSKR